MESSTEVTAVIPLLFLLVTQISSAGREMDLVKLAGDHSPLVLSFLPKRLFPNIGRFNFVHGINTAALTVTVIISAGLVEGVQSGLLVVISLVLWAATPVLEVDEYDRILANADENVRHSFRVHIAGVVIYGVSLAVASKCYLNPLSTIETMSEWLFLAAGGVAVFFSGFVFYIVYLYYLRKELEGLQRS